MALRLLLVLLVLVLPAAARAQAAPDGVVEVASGSERVVDVGPVDETVVVSASGIEVFQVSPTSVLVRADQVGGDALVLLRRGGEVTSLQIRGVRPAPPAGPRAGPPPVTGAPRVDVGGQYTLQDPGGDLPVGFTAYHWADWSQATTSFALDARTGVVRTPGGRWGLSDLAASLRTDHLSIEAGDLDEVLAASAGGYGGAGVELRGLRASVAPLDAPLRFGVLAGAYRTRSCCAFAEPDRAMLGGVTVAWVPEHGTWGELLGGALRRGVDPAPSLLLRAAGGWRSDGALVDARYTQAGPGAAASLLARVHATDQVEVHLRASGTSRGFRDPSRTFDAPRSGSATAGVSYRVARVTDLEAELYGVARDAYLSVPALSQAGGRAALHWSPGPVWLSASYERFVKSSEAVSTSGDALGADFGGRTWNRLSLGTNGRVVLQRGLRARVYGALYAGIRVVGQTDLRSTYQVASYEGTTSHTGLLGLRTRAGDLRAEVDGEILVRRKAEANQSLFIGFTDLSWRLRKVLDLGAGASVTTSAPYDRLVWSVNASWTLHLDALSRRQGGLGLRGRVTGVVYLDKNYDGKHDEEEPGLPDVAVTVDGSRTVRTDADGRYRLGGLTVGSHTLSFDRGEMHALGATERQLDVQATRSDEEDLGLTWGGRVQGLLYVDLHDNDIYDNGDFTVPVEEVLLRDTRDVVVARLPAPDGRFAFSGLEAGDYTVIVDPLSLPGGYHPVDPLQKTVQVEEGKPVTVPIRLQAVRALGGIVWEDGDGDGRGGGKQDVGIGGVQVYLSDGQTTHTGPDGTFLFRNLPPGGYAVSTDLSSETQVEVLSKGPKEILDLSFVLPRGTRAPQPQPGHPRRRSSEVTGVALDAPIDVLPQGVVLQVTATAVLSNGETREVTSRARWATSDADVLDVSPTGQVQGKRAGNAGVTAEYQGAAAPPLDFEVLGKPLDQVTVSPVGLRLNPGDTADLRVDVVDKAGRGGEVTPVVTWKVADPRVARVDEQGRLHALHDGATTVTASVGGAASTPLAVQVITAKVTALSIEDLPARMPPGSTCTLRATGYDTDLQVQDVTGTVTWASSDPR